MFVVRVVSFSGVERLSVWQHEPTLKTEEMVEIRRLPGMSLRAWEGLLEAPTPEAQERRLRLAWDIGLSHWKQPHIEWSPGGEDLGRTRS